MEHQQQVLARDRAVSVQKGKRYRLVLRNGSGDQHPMHLHRHTFEISRVGKKEMSGLLKNVVNVMPLGLRCS